VPADAPASGGAGMGPAAGGEVRPAPRDAGGGRRAYMPSPVAGRAGASATAGRAWSVPSIRGRAHSEVSDVPGSAVSPSRLSGTGDPSRSAAVSAAVEAAHRQDVSAAVALAALAGRRPSNPGPGRAWAGAERPGWRSPGHDGRGAGLAGVSPPRHSPPTSSEVSAVSSPADAFRESMARLHAISGAERMLAELAEADSDDDEASDARGTGRARAGGSGSRAGKTQGARLDGLAVGRLAGGAERWGGASMLMDSAAGASRRGLRGARPAAGSESFTSTAVGFDSVRRRLASVELSARR